MFRFFKNRTHTAQRLCQVQNDVICMIVQCDLVTFLYKAGFDGFTDQSIYFEKMFVNNLRHLKKEELLFLTCLLPYRITTC